MSRLLAALAIVVSLFGFSPRAQAAPLSAYGRLPLIEDAQVSPDGEMIAYTLTDGENRIIVIRRIADGAVVSGLRMGDTKVRDVRWAGIDYLLITKSETARVMDLSGPRREYLLTTAYELATGRQRGLMDHAERSMNVVLSLPRVRRVKGALVAIVDGVNFVGNRGQVGLFEVTLKDGRSRLLEPGFEDTDDWVVGADGTALAQTDYNQQKGRWRLRFRQGSGWPIAAEGEYPIEQPYLAGLGRDGRSVLVVDSNEAGRPVLREYPDDQSEPRELTTEPFDFLIADPGSQALIGMAALAGEEHRYTFFDPKADAVWKAVVKAYAGSPVELVSWSDDRRRIVVRVDSPTTGPAYALVDLDSKAANWLGDVYAGLKPADIAEVRTVTYRAGDGLEITGYLTLPRGKDARGLPLVVLPHGGPATRDGPGFDWWAQALASRGYAVLQPNFRGSDGFGPTFLEAGYGQFGRRMQTDLSDGVRDLAAKGVIDPARVCIVGASYGGYAALAGPTLDPGVYRCVAAIAGISDLRRFMDSQVRIAGPRQNATLRYWSRFLGVDGRRDPDLAAISPITHVDKVDIPILLVHGKDDTVVLYNQSQIMFDALRKAGKPVEMVTLQGEDHWLSRGDTRLQMLEAVVSFLEKHNPPG
jgi:dipeptidyl aminopeptidase/acylaminoacyl peptidase